ncbi:uncharacterized protein LOC133860320 [Alnus glutinosa]|uniref:uncharacterized protein LOC133860320 n=1 Tax=Alnus glutinosa TaxID=3517 RepID=UPI002D76ABE1|nr:uncharacterized protein LOC133860320 [Alnus glutinosa]
MAFLGHFVTKDVIVVDRGKVKAVVNYARPSNAHKVRSFLGLAGYYKRFVEAFSRLAAPLTRLTRKNDKFQWLEECEQSFQKLKQRLVTATDSHYFIGDCQGRTSETYGVLATSPIPELKWEHISMKFVYGFPRASSGQDAVWVIVDRLTKMTHFLPIKMTYIMDWYTELYIKEIVRLHGIPAIARLEGQLESLVAEVTKIEEEELQGQVMVEGHYMIDKDDSSNPRHEHVQATATFESENDNEEEEKEEHLEQTTPLPNPNMSNDKEGYDIQRLPAQ